MHLSAILKTIAMIINVLGELINTNNIRSIEKIYNINEKDYDDDDEFYSDNVLCITFIGAKRDFVICSDDSDEDDKRLTYKQICSIRDQIIDIWKGNQSDIPKIKTK